jgi:hypothetical protein
MKFSVPPNNKSAAIVVIVEVLMFLIKTPLWNITRLGGLVWTMSHQIHCGRQSSVPRSRGSFLVRAWKCVNSVYDSIKEGEKDIYRVAKSRERKTRDIIQVKCIKDETEQLIIKDEDIKNRWREYFDKLFNGDSVSSSIELDISSDDLNRHFVRSIQESEVKDALKRMKEGKAMGPDGIPIKVWRSFGDVAIVWLTKLFNLIFRSNKMPDE